MNNGAIAVATVADGQVRILNLPSTAGIRTLVDILHSDKPATLVNDLAEKTLPISIDQFTMLAPVDDQEIWGAGVTYKRSREARERESAGAARFYELVYTAQRPELFLKATPNRVAGPGAHVRIRRDSRWSVPEPELALVISPRMKIVGYTIGNDMSARDIEGENPLYLPQAKVYDHSCALGPVVTLADAMPPPDQVVIKLLIERGGGKIFEGTTRLSQMVRSLDELVQWLGRDNTFPNGVILLTGTGIVPPDDFSLAARDVVTIEITGIGRLVNIVEQNT